MDLSCFGPNDLRPTIFGCQATDSIPPQASRNDLRLWCDAVGDRTPASRTPSGQRVVKRLKHRDPGVLQRNIKRTCLHIPVSHFVFIFVPKSSSSPPMKSKSSHTRVNWPSYRLRHTRLTVPPYLRVRMYIVHSMKRVLWCLYYYIPPRCREN